MTSDFYDHDGPGGQPTDMAGDEQMMRQMYTLIPDLHITIENMVAEGELCLPQSLERHERQNGPSDRISRICRMALRGQ